MIFFKWVFILIVFAKYSDGATNKPILSKRILVTDDPLPATNKTSSISKKDLEKFTAVEPIIRNPQNKSFNHLHNHKNVSMDEMEDISRYFEVIDTEEEPLTIHLNELDLLPKAGSQKPKPKKSRKKGKNKIDLLKNELPIIWPDLSEIKENKDNSAKSESIKEPSQMQSQNAEHVYIPDTIIGVGYPQNHGLNSHNIHNGHPHDAQDLSFLIENQLKLGYAPQHYHLPLSPPVIQHTPHHKNTHTLLSQPSPIYKHTPPSITIPAHGSLFNHWPYRPYGYKWRYYPHPYHRWYPHKHPIVGGKYPLPSHGYGFANGHGVYGARRPQIVYMYPYYPPAKEKTPIVGFSDWKEKPIKEEIEGDIMYDFRTKTHTINR